MILLARLAYAAREKHSSPTMWGEATIKRSRPAAQAEDCCLSQCKGCRCRSLIKQHIEGVQSGESMAADACDTKRIQGEPAAAQTQGKANQHKPQQHSNAAAATREDNAAQSSGNKQHSMSSIGAEAPGLQLAAYQLSSPRSHG